jgi:DNA-binding NarL/FixJ family response regulator
MEAPIIPTTSATPGRRIRVGLVDDHPTIGAALATAIAETTDLVLVDQARTLDAAVALANRVDVVVCDVQLDGRAEGIQLLEDAAARPNPPAFLMLSGHRQASVVRAALERGAAGYLDKGAELDEIVAAIRIVAAGGTVYSAAQLRMAGDALRRPSGRELEVIELVVAGATNAEIGASLGVTEKTVESHLRRLFDRYGLLSRTELAVLALQESWAVGHRPA